ncbi:DUF2786 domain-containing protein [Amycolatopsis sp. Hca4]|uniref:DUF2786 domain-containing protein n=1 Tax=unclassified Amycolatopsis TaxID=2618356 RepID=UPI00158FC1E5|nr:DUF2786 domain-containing protein [Amycolatopsis sp. Hca4]QKV80067.1 DUF2786 domain-containing protein [Amycolatopsis sp. Hca4]
MTTISPPITATWVRCHDTARAEGMAPALAVLHAALPAGADAAGAGGAAVRPAGPADRDGDVLVVRTAELPGGPVVLVRAPRPAGGPDPVLATGSVWLRLGLSGALLDTGLAYLGGRRSGDTTLLRRQMVQGAVAEALTGQLEVRAFLTAHEAGPPPEALAYLHRRLTETDRVLLRLLGAAGYVRGGAGEVADVSELLAGAYTPEAVA